MHEITYTTIQQMTCRPHRQEYLDLTAKVLKTIWWFVFDKETTNNRFMFYHRGSSASGWCAVCVEDPEIPNSILNHKKKEQIQELVFKHTSMFKQSSELELHVRYSEAAISFCSSPDRNKRMHVY